MTSASSQTLVDIAAVGRIPAMSRILEVVTRLSGMRFAAVARVTDMEWTACAVRDEIDFGLKVGGQLELRTTICDEIRQHHEPVVFGNASAHPHFSTHHTPRLYKLESYISVPIFRPSGEFFGTLCAIDPKPQEFDETNLVATLQLFAEMIGSQLGATAQLQLSDTALRGALANSATREDNLHRLAREMRDPIQSVLMEAHLLKTSHSDVAGIVSHAEMIESNAWRISEKLEWLTSATYAKVSNATSLAAVAPAELVDEMDATLAEAGREFPDRAIASNFSFDKAVRCDARRLGELLTQVIRHVAKRSGNAFPITVGGSTAGDFLVLQVVCHGTRKDELEHEMESGLELLVAREMASDQGGIVHVATPADEIRITFRMPLDDT